MPHREAHPGAIKVPPGARDRERLRALEDHVAKLPSGVSDPDRFLALEERISSLEKKLEAISASGTPAAPSTPGGVVTKPEGEPDKAALVAKANALGAGAPSQLNRWSIEKLQSFIAEKEKA